MATVATEAEARAVYRKFDWIVISAAFFVLAGGFHVHHMLVAGDWSFWVDWKDRRWWPILNTTLTITFCAAVQSCLWPNFRIPIGATISVVALHFGQWMDRFWNHYDWTWYPLSLVFPETAIPSAIVLDCILLLTNSWVMTALAGGEAFSFLFVPSNWFMVGPYHVPVELHGQVLTVADLIGFEYVRTSMPEYIRMVERGTLRAFAGGTFFVSIFFAGFVCVLMYFVWWQFGYWLTRPVFSRTM
jgi:methane/ammonia monooxygenase subunit A